LDRTGVKRQFFRFDILVWFSSAALNLHAKRDVMHYACKTTQSSRRCQRATLAATLLYKRQWRIQRGAPLYWL